MTIKDIKIILKYVLLGVLFSACMVFGWWVGHRNSTNTVEYVTDTVTVTDTITNMDYDTLYFSHYDTINTTDVVIINDTVNDTTYIQLPIYTYIYDTIIQKEDYQTHLKATVSGFGVTVDTLVIDTKIMPQQPQNAPRWYNNIVPAVGVGFGTGGAGVFVGVGYKIF